MKSSFIIIACERRLILYLQYRMTTHSRNNSEGLPTSCGGFLELELSESIDNNNDDSEDHQSLLSSRNKTNNNSSSSLSKLAKQLTSPLSSHRRPSKPIQPTSQPNFITKFWLESSITDRRSIAIILFFTLLTIALQWIHGGRYHENKFHIDGFDNNVNYSTISDNINVFSSGSGGGGRGKGEEVYSEYYSISTDIKLQYATWHKVAYSNLSNIQLHSNYTLPISNWNVHPKERYDRFPSVYDRVQYYMGSYYNKSLPLYGSTFYKAIYINYKTTRNYGPFASILINLYNLNQQQLMECYTNKKELKVFSPYCRDYIDIAILSKEGTANVLSYIGDGLPFVSEKLRDYPLFAKVRPFCDSNHRDTVSNATSSIESSNIESKGSSCKLQQNVARSIETILLPLNRHRHYGIVSSVPENDIPYEQKIPKAVWRGQYGKPSNRDSDSMTTDDIKYALVYQHLNSTIVNAKYSKHIKDAPSHLIGQYLDMSQQLKYKYIISIEGNDVSSGLKWMLFSNSIVLTPSFTWESWTMEGMLKPFVHYIPINNDMSNVEEMIEWAESHPEESKLISERSTLFIYDLLFHPNAAEDEIRIMIGIMERFENNFGHDLTRRQKSSRENNPLLQHVHWDKHPFDRSQRFPSIDERVKYVMGKWYHNNNNSTISMTRSNLQKISSLEKLNNNIGDYIASGHLFIANGEHISECAATNSTYSHGIRELCQSSLPEFDERNTADLKSNSFHRLQESDGYPELKLAEVSSWRHDEKGLKESKRVLLDDTVKLLCYFGDCSHDEEHYPYFARHRRSDEAILWPFGIESSSAITKTTYLQSLDIPFDKKHLLYMTLDEVIREEDEVYEVVNKVQIKTLLSHRYILVSDRQDRITNDLLWLLLSQSVVLMSAERQTTSWLMEGLLEPNVHFVPVVASDHSNVTDTIKWCKDNTEEVKLISERATLFVYDTLFHSTAEKENEEVKFQVMERYSELFG